MASVFLSRVDTLVDAQLASIGTQEALSLRGKAAVAMAKLAYQRYLETFTAQRFVETGATRLHARKPYCGQAPG